MMYNNEIIVLKRILMKSDTGPWVPRSWMYEIWILYVECPSSIICCLNTLPGFILAFLAANSNLAFLN